MRKAIAADNTEGAYVYSDRSCVPIGRRRSLDLTNVTCQN